MAFDSDDPGVVPHAEPHLDAGGLADGASACSSSTGALEMVWSLPTVTPSAVAIDSRGSVYVTGSFTGIATFGTTSLVSAGQSDIFLAKYDPTGVVLWATSYGNAANDDESPAIAVDPTGNAFLTGFFSGTIDFGGGSKPLVAIGVDGFAVKITPNGQTAWADHLGYDSGPYDVTSVAVGPDGDPVIAGTALGTIVLGNAMWAAQSPAEQPFVAKLSAADGSIVWSAAAGGNFDTDHVHVAVDATGRAFVVGRVLSGAGAWGAEPAPAVGFACTFRVGFDTSGAPSWSHFDVGAEPASAAIDQAGRLAVVERGFAATTVDATTFDITVQSSLALVFSPNDGTLLSSAVLPDTFPWAGAVDARGNTFIAGQYSRPITVGGTTLGAPGPPAVSAALFIAALDGASRPEGAQGLGAAGNTLPYGLAVGRSGRIVVIGTTDTPFTTVSASLKPGAFVAVFSPDTCALDAGPSGASTGDASDRGDLPVDGSIGLGLEPPSSACPLTQAEATNGAACPAAMGCPYDTTCCSCAPTSCGPDSSLWTCDPLGAPDPSCPFPPPDAGGVCPSGVQCNYCLPGGRYYANCTNGGWSVGYAQILCNK